MSALLPQYSRNFSTPSRSVSIRPVARTLALQRGHSDHRICRYCNYAGFPDSLMSSKTRRWIKYLSAVLFGNALYLVLLPWLPPRARHHKLIDWGTFVDLWFCLFVYGVIELAAFLLQRLRAFKSK